MVDFGHETSVGYRGVKDMINVNREHLEETFAASCGNGVCSMVVSSPSISPIASCAIGKLVKDAFVRVLFGTKEHKAEMELINGRIIFGHMTYCSRV